MGFEKTFLVNAPLARGFANVSVVKAPLVKHPCICRKKTKMCIGVYSCGRLEVSLGALVGLRLCKATKCFSRGYSRGFTRILTRGFGRAFIKGLARGFTMAFARGFTRCSSRAFTRCFVRGFTRILTRGFARHFTLVFPRGFTRCSTRAFIRALIGSLLGGSLRPLLWNL